MIPVIGTSTHTISSERIARKVQVSFRERILVQEPFLLVGLIAVIRRALVLTAELAQVHDIPDEVFRRFIMELVVAPSWSSRWSSRWFCYGNGEE